MDWSSFQFDLRFDADRLRDLLLNIEAYRLSLNKLILLKEYGRGRRGC